MNTSIVIPLASNGFGSRWGDTELRYCLRSIEKHLKGYGDIFLIGHKPNWVKNIIHIPATDGDKIYEKEKNIFNKIMLAVNDERVTDDFLFMNDDHYLMHDYEAKGFPYYYHGTGAEQINKRTDPYSTTLKNTYPHALGAFIASYWDIHCPILYNKEGVRLIAEEDWTKKWGYCIKTLYCEEMEIEGIEYPDLKIQDQFLSYSEIKELIKGRAWFSIHDRCRNDSMLAVLQELYPKKSKYEK